MCLLCQGAGASVNSRSSVLREETDLCVLCTSPQMHPGAPARLRVAHFQGDASFCFGDAALKPQVPAAALKPPGAHHPQSFMTPKGQSRQGKRQVGRRGAASQAEPRTLQQWLFQ